jgi:gamma-glutamylcyclotransferase (GGCT)/AIG2-like uncharacterized protein YtfP
MESRTRPVRQKQVCVLKGYRLAFNKQGDSGDIFANIVAEHNGEVWGVIYLCDEAAMAKLDIWEGVANGHYRREPVTVVTKAGETVPAITYVAQAAYVCAEGRPSDGYLGKILKGAVEHDLPAEYIKSIKELAGRGGEV